MRARWLAQMGPTEVEYLPIAPERLPPGAFGEHYCIRTAAVQPRPGTLVNLMLLWAVKPLSRVESSGARVFRLVGGLR